MNKTCLIHMLLLLIIGLVLLLSNGCENPAGLAAVIDQLVEHPKEPPLPEWTFEKIVDAQDYSAYDPGFYFCDDGNSTYDYSDYYPDRGPILLVDSKGSLHTAYVNSDYEFCYATNGDGHTLAEGLSLDTYVAAFDLSLDSSEEAQFAYATPSAVYYGQVSGYGSNLEFNSSQYFQDFEWPVAEGSFRDVEVLKASDYLVAYMDVDGNVSIESEELFIFNGWPGDGTSVIDIDSNEGRADGFTMEASSSVGNDNIHLAIDITDGLTSEQPEVTGALQYTKSDNYSDNLESIHSGTYSKFSIHTDDNSLYGATLRTPSMAISDSGTVHISYFIGNPFASFELRYVNSDDWAKKYKIAEGNAANNALDPYYGDYSKIAVGDQNHVYVLFRNLDKELQLAELCASDVASTLSITTIKKAGTVGAGMDIAVDTSQSPNVIHLLYESNDSLYHAYKVAHSR